MLGLPKHNEHSFFYSQDRPTWFKIRSKIIPKNSSVASACYFFAIFFRTNLFFNNHQTMLICLLFGMLANASGKGTTNYRNNVYTWAGLRIVFVH